MTYLVGDDGSAAAGDAAAFARVLAGAQGADVVVARTATAEGLRERAAELGAELIAVGAARGRHVGSGSLAAHLLHGATCPVLAVPAGAPAKVGTVGAAYDGRHESRAALNTAIHLASVLGAQLLVLGVHQPQPPSGLPGEVVDPGRADFEHGIARVSFDTHGGVDHRVLTGRPGTALADASAGLDLLVTGSSRHGALRSVVFGTVPRHLVEHAACPVLVVPRAT